MCGFIFVKELVYIYISIDKGKLGFSRAFFRGKKKV